MKIIVDMMGGDNAPLAVLEGAAQAVKEYGVQLIGVIPEDYELVLATGKGQPIPSTAPSLAAFDAIAKRLKGENAPLTVKIK